MAILVAKSGGQSRNRMTLKSIGTNSRVLSSSLTPRFGGGNFRLGLLDVENDVSIVESDWIEPSPTDLAWDQLSSPPKLPEEPRHIRIKIPSSVGRKAYRLVVQPTQDTRAATFWATGQITFPSVSLGGTYITCFTPPEAP